VSSPAIDALVERSSELKLEVIEFAYRPQFARTLREAIRERFGGPTIVGDESEITNFLDWFIQQRRLHDGRTVVDRFLDSRNALPAIEREFLLGWRDVREGIFEILGHDGGVLLAENVLDDLPYRIHANAGPKIADRMPPGSFVFARVVPVVDEWLLSGMQNVFPADTRDVVLKAAAELVTEHPEAVYRNPRFLARGWEIQRAHREAFVGRFGSDEITVKADALPRVVDGFFSSLRRDGSLARPQWSVGEAETVGVIYDEANGLGFYLDYALAEEAFAHPDLISSRRHTEIVAAYLTDDSVDPIPIQRLAARYPDNAGRVVRAALHKPGLRWEGDGEEVLRRFKAKWYERPILPRVTVVTDRLAAYFPGADRAQPARRTRRRAQVDARQEPLFDL
jgi:hypothetical protein